MSSDVSVRGGWGVIGIELIFADELQHAGLLEIPDDLTHGHRPSMIVSSRLLVLHKIDARCGDRFLQADFSLPILIATCKTGEITLD